MALKQNSAKSAQKPRVKTPAKPAETAIAAAEPRPDWPLIAELKAKIGALRQEKAEVDLAMKEIVWSAALSERGYRLRDEISECADRLEQAELDRRRHEFKPCVDVHNTFLERTDERLKSHLEYVWDMVDDLDKQLLCQAIELLKREHGTEGAWLQPGELVETIFFLLGAGEYRGGKPRFR